MANGTGSSRSAKQEESVGRLSVALRRFAVNGGGNCSVLRLPRQQLD